MALICPHCKGQYIHNIFLSSEIYDFSAEFALCFNCRVMMQYFMKRIDGTHNPGLFTIDEPRELSRYTISTLNDPYFNIIARGEVGWP